MKKTPEPTATGEEETMMVREAARSRADQSQADIKHMAERGGAPTTENDRRRSEPAGSRTRERP